MVTCFCFEDWRGTVPSLTCLFAWIIFIINCVAPGVGTIIVGVITCNFECILIGILMSLLAPFIIGWIWSIYWGWLCVVKARAVPVIYPA